MPSLIWITSECWWFAIADKLSLNNTFVTQTIYFGLPLSFFVTIGQNNMHDFNSSCIPSNENVPLVLIYNLQYFGGLLEGIIL